MVNIDWLRDNLTNLTINNSLVENPEETIANMVTNTNDLSQGYWGLGVMIVVFITMLWITTRPDGKINLDAPRGLLVASAFSSVIGLIGIVSPLFVSYIHVIWFLVIFILSYVWIILLRKDGRL